MTSPYHPKGSKQKKKPRNETVSVRMTAKDYKAYVAYCRKREITLSDGMNDFARAMMAQDFAKELQAYIEMASLVATPWNSLTQMSRRETWRQVCEIITEEVKAQPTHCHQCKKVLPLDGTAESLAKVTIHGGYVYCSLPCAIQGQESNEHQEVIDQWKHLMKIERKHQRKKQKARQELLTEKLKVLIPESYRKFGEIAKK